MEKSEIFGKNEELLGYRMISPKGIESKMMTLEQAKNAVSKGYFYHETETIKKDNSYGPCSDYTLNRSKCKIAKVRKYIFVTKVVEENYSAEEFKR